MCRPRTAPPDRSPLRTPGRRGPATTGWRCVCPRKPFCNENPSHKQEGGALPEIGRCGKARGGRISAGIFDRRATQPQRQRSATLRDGGLRGGGGGCVLLTHRGAVLALSPP